MRERDVAEHVLAPCIDGARLAIDRAARRKREPACGLTLALGLGLEDGQQGGEQVHDGRIEAVPRILPDPGQRIVAIERQVVGAIRRQCVELVDDREDARTERNRIARETVRVATPVPALVVGEHVRRHGVRERHASEDLGAHLRVYLDLLALLRSERTRLAQDVLRHGELADVVEQRGRAHALHVGGRHAERFREAGRVDLDPAQVRRGRLVLGVDGERQRLDRRKVQLRELP